MSVITVVFVLSGLLMVALAIPMIRCKVPPNPWYGFRIPLTLKNPKIWYAVNAYFGRLLRFIGFVTIGMALLCPLIPGITVDGYAALITASMVVSLLLAVVLGLLYAKSLDTSGGNSAP